MVRTSGAIFSWANWRTVSRKSVSSSESRVSGDAGWDARTESATGLPQRPFDSFPWMREPFKLPADMAACPPAALQREQRLGYGEKGGDASCAPCVVVVPTG